MASIPVSLIHYRFNSSTDYTDAVHFEGPVLSVFDLKKAIVQQKNLLTGDTPEFDLLITNAETGEMHRDNGMLINKNSTVIVRRIPSKGNRGLRHILTARYVISI